jgi:hypothetical protein
MQGLLAVWKSNEFLGALEEYVFTDFESKLSRRFAVRLLLLLTLVGFQAYAEDNVPECQSRVLQANCVKSTRDRTGRLLNACASEGFIRSSHGDIELERQPGDCRYFIDFHPDGSIKSAYVEPRQEVWVGGEFLKTGELGSFLSYHPSGAASILGKVQSLYLSPKQEIEIADQRLHAHRVHFFANGKIAEANWIFGETPLTFDIEGVEANLVESESRCHLIGSESGGIEGITCNTGSPINSPRRFIVDVQGLKALYELYYLPPHDQFKLKLIPTHASIILKNSRGRYQTVDADKYFCVNRSFEVVTECGAQ